MANQKDLICKCNCIKVDASIKKSNRARAEDSGKNDTNEKSKGKRKWVEPT